MSGEIVWAALAAKAHADGGFTYRTSDGVFPSKGFVVAVDKGAERVLPGDICATCIESFALDNKSILDAGNIVFKGGMCLGAWYNAADARWYLDLSVVCRSLDEALTIGRHNGQLAVYDLEAGESIAIPYHAQPVAV